jgi:hypothetical protein
VTGRYFSLGEDADAVADDYVRHYYGDDYFAVARADTLTSTERLGAERAALERAGATDVLLYPASGGLEQVGLLAEALRQAGFAPAGNPWPAGGNPNRPDRGRRGCDQRRAADDRRRGRAAAPGRGGRLHSRGAVGGARSRPSPEGRAAAPLVRGDHFNICGRQVRCSGCHRLVHPKMLGLLDSFLAAEMEPKEGFEPSAF